MPPWTPKISVYHQNGRVVMWEEIREITTLGNSLTSYRLEGDKILMTRYTDHACRHTIPNRPVDPSKVPDEVMEVLGKPLDEVTLPEDWEVVARK